MHIATKSGTEIAFQTERNISGVVMRLSGTSTQALTLGKLQSTKVMVQLVNEGETITILPKMGISEASNLLNFGSNGIVGGVESEGEYIVYLNWSGDQMNGASVEMKRNAEYTITVFTPNIFNCSISGIEDDERTSFYLQTTSFRVNKNEPKIFKTRTPQGTTSGILLPFQHEDREANDFDLRLSFENGRTQTISPLELEFLALAGDESEVLEYNDGSRVTNRSVHVDFEDYANPVVSYEVINRSSSDLSIYITTLKSI